jgi:hypothetical protein
MAGKGIAVDNDNKRLRSAIAALDLQIYHLRDRLRSGNNPPNGADEDERDRLRREVDRLVALKADLRVELAKLQATVA